MRFRVPEADRFELRGVNWSHLAALADRHRMVPLLHALLAPRAEELLPEFHAWLREAAHGIARQNAPMARELLRLLGLFKEHQVLAIPFKGPVLALDAYGDLGMRQYSDLDIVVRQQDLSSAAELLRGAGYNLVHRSLRDTDVIHVRTEYHYPFRNDLLGVTVELHHRFVPVYFAFRLTLEQAAWRMRTLALGGGSIGVLPLEETVVTLCAHGAKHAWKCLDFVSTLAALVQRKPEALSEELLALSRSLGASRMVLVGLHLANRLFSLALPGHIGHAIGSDPAVAVIGRQVIAELLAGEVSPAGLLRTPRFHLRCRERWGDRVSYCSCLILGPTWEDIEWCPLPGRWRMLYWLVRPVRLLILAARGALGRWLAFRTSPVAAGANRAGL